MLKWLSIASCIDRLYRYSKAPVEIFLASLGAPRSRHRIALCPAEVYHSAGQGPNAGAVSASAGGSAYDTLEGVGAQTVERAPYIRIL